jgi:hypothetical protein
VTLQTSGIVDSIPPDYEGAEALVEDIAGKHCSVAAPTRRPAPRFHDANAVTASSHRSPSGARCHTKPQPVRPHDDRSVTDWFVALCWRIHP